MKKSLCSSRTCGLAHSLPEENARARTWDEGDVSEATYGGPDIQIVKGLGMVR